MRAPLATRTHSNPDKGAHLLAATENYPLLEVFWTILIFVGFFIWIWLLFVVFADIFRRTDLSGWGKTGWIIFVIILPYLGVFVYLIAEHKGMTERTVKDQKTAQSEMDSYVRQVAGAQRPDPADREGRRTAESRHDHAGRVRHDQGQGAGLGDRAVALDGPVSAGQAIGFTPAASRQRSTRSGSLPLRTRSRVYLPSAPGFVTSTSITAPARR